MTTKFLETQANHEILPQISQWLDGQATITYKKPESPDLMRYWSPERKLSFLRQNKLGRLSLIPSPNFFTGSPGNLKGLPYKTLLHLDYTASAQGLEFIESYIKDFLRTYANTHTETSATGKSSTRRFHQAIDIIRNHVGAGKDSFVIPCGYGATGAIERIQKILGLYFSPKGQKNVSETLNIDLKNLLGEKYVVFVGPSEHHSNDVTWQDAALCSFVRIKAIKTGPMTNHLDLVDLEKQLKKYSNHIKIGSFSAASNVTGMETDLKAIGKILKQHEAYFFVDYAASGPYTKINIDEIGIDGIFLSTHKNIGGVNLGLLVGKNRIYDPSVHPSFGGGGTVTAVTPWEYHFHEKIEEREYPGTPAIRQVWQAALSFQIKEWIGFDTIRNIDQTYTKRFIAFMEQHPMLSLLGNADPHLRVPIFSFLIKHGDKMLHHTLVAALLNDLFGIQARSGCACAGPFGHELLGIEKDLSDRYVELILNVLNGFKPGWTRIGIHYTLSEEEFSYTLKALNAIAYFGPLFLDQYSLDPYTGEWIHDHAPEIHDDLDIRHAIYYSGQHTQLPHLDTEESLYKAFSKQWQEFLLIASAKIAAIVIAEAPHLGKDAFDQLTMAALKPIEEFLDEPNFATATQFSSLLAQELCPLIAPPGKNPEQCLKDIRDMLDRLIFRPQNNLGRYEDFSKFAKDVDFFYVPKNKLTRHIDMQTIEHHSKTSHCHPCRS